MAINVRNKWKPSTREEYLAYRAGVRHSKRTIIREINRRLYASKEKEAEKEFVIAATIYLEALREYVIVNLVEPDLPKELRVTRGKPKEKAR